MISIINLVGLLSLTMVSFGFAPVLALSLLLLPVTASIPRIETGPYTISGRSSLLIPIWISLGLSSGAFFATQFEFAFSSEISGVGVFAGGPFYVIRFYRFFPSHWLLSALKALFPLPWMFACDFLRESMTLNSILKLECGQVREFSIQFPILPPIST